MNLPMVCIVVAAHRDNINLVWAARGLGPECFTRRLCVSGAATPETPPTHWLMSDATATDAEVATCQRMSDGDLPPLPEGVAWGVDGVISAADALAAIDGSALQVYSVSGDVEPVDHVSGILASRGLQYVPDPDP